MRLPRFRARRRQKQLRRSLRGRIEPLSPRRLLVADICEAPPADPVELRDEAWNPEADDLVDAQYAVHQPPRLQIGNAPLVGTPAFDDTDQVELVWQTTSAGEGLNDAFDVSFRHIDDVDWEQASLNEIIDTEQDSRLMHSATLRGLNWNATYEYRVVHRRGDETVTTYGNRFRTRLRPADPTAFSFAAYGDSARGGANVANFNRVQTQIIRHDPDFSVLLGDNFYTFGTHADADNRMTVERSPQAVEWTSQKIDYPAIGNHDIFVRQGQASRDLYSTPIPVAGENSHVDLPAGEFPEHSFSFDYGNVHFVTFDTNPVDVIQPEIRAERIEKLVDYVVADLAASDAQWKIVYGHHPFIGTEKRQTPDDIYFRTVVERLREADVDLVMLGHSHTYSWTYPIAGFEDRDESETIEIEEVDYIADTDREYDKGAGLIQLVSGAGGGSLRSPAYSEPVFAKAYSLAETTGPLEYGFAKVQVTSSDLTVSYISAETGQIVGDLNGNGSWDEGETYFGQFSIVDRGRFNGDVNEDGGRDAADLDAIGAAINRGEYAAIFDLNEDGFVDEADRATLLRLYFNTTYGDANLDGRFNSSDLVSVFIEGEYEDDIAGNSSWSTGDWNGDGEFTSADFVIALTAGAFSVF